MNCEDDLSGYGHTYDLDYQVQASISHEINSLEISLLDSIHILGDRVNLQIISSFFAHYC